MKIKALIGSGIVAGALLVGNAAGAAVTFDSTNGTGFSGKGDVQLALNLNNKQLNDAANTLGFTYQSVDTTVTEVTWVCTNSRNESLQERERTTTTVTAVSGLVKHTERDNKKQITGFRLGGWNGDKTETASPPETDGPAVNSCPGGSTWSLTTPAGVPEVTKSSTGGLFVNGTPLPITPLA